MARTVPPWISTRPASAAVLSGPLPMPAAQFPPVAVTAPPLIVTAEQGWYRLPPMPAPRALPPRAVTVPPLTVIAPAVAVALPMAAWLSSPVESVPSVVPA